MAQTDFSKKCELLGKVYTDSFYVGRLSPELHEFVSTEAFVLPLAWSLSKGFCEPNDKSYEFINQAYDSYLEIVSVENVN